MEDKASGPQYSVDKALFVDILQQNGLKFFVTSFINRNFAINGHY